MYQYGVFWHAQPDNLKLSIRDFYQRFHMFQNCMSQEKRFWNCLLEAKILKLSNIYPGSATVCHENDRQIAFYSPLYCIKDGSTDLGPVHRNMFARGHWASVLVPYIYIMYSFWSGISSEMYLPILIYLLCLYILNCPKKLYRPKWCEWCSHGHGAWPWASSSGCSLWRLSPCTCRPICTCNLHYTRPLPHENLSCGQISPHDRFFPGVPPVVPMTNMRFGSSNNF